MPAFIKKTYVNNESWTALNAAATAGKTLTIYNDQPHSLKVGLATAMGDIAGTLLINPGEERTFSDLPAGAIAYAQWMHSVKKSGDEEVTAYIKEVQFYVNE